jgi:hypothetical protein
MCGIKIEKNHLELSRLAVGFGVAHSSMRAFIIVSALAVASGLRLASLPHLPSVLLAPRIVRHADARCGFEIDNVDQKAIEELGVFNWPGLERRVQDFDDRAVDGKLKMVYVKQGSATLADSADKATVSAGQMVLIDDQSEVSWTGISEGGLVLLSCETVLDDDASGSTSKPSAQPAGQKDLAGKPLGDAMQEEMGELSLGGLVIQLGLGLLSGSILAVGLKLFLTPDS